MGQKKWTGRSLAAMSNAGYETVGIADSVRGEGWDLRLAKLAESTRTRLQAALVKGKLETLVDVKNPFDITPMANDEVNEDAVQAFLDDPGVDMILCASVPLTPVMATLAEGVPEEMSIRSQGSLVNRLAKIGEVATKPIVACIDSGVLYDPMARMLENNGIPCFRSADEAIRAMGKYLEGRLRNAR
jgi:acyl-CoA synthetase (NDP forming)